MKKRSTEILQKLIKHSSRKYSISKLANEYNVTSRTLRNDIAEMNNFLQSIGASELSIDKKGIIQIGKSINKELVEKKLYEMDIYSYKMSSEERRIYILLKLLQIDEYYSMKALAEELYVSRVTILNDFDRIKDYLEQFQILIESDAGKGVALLCERTKKLELLIALFKEISINKKNDGVFQHLMLKELRFQYTFSEVFTYLQEYTNASNIVFIDDVFYDIVLYIFAELNLPIIEDEQPVGAKEKLTVMDYMMLYVGYMTEQVITNRMLGRFQKYLENNNLSAFVKTIDEIELYKVITHFLSAIDIDKRMELTVDGMLIDSLLLHIKSMKNWGNYEVDLPKSSQLNIDYDGLEDKVDSNAYILERFLSYKLSENMKKSIVIHICVSLIRNHKQDSKLLVAIVCPGSMATGKYLEAQIKNYFDFDIIGVIAANEVQVKLKETNKKADFIISTVPLHLDEYKVLVVNPLLTMEDMNLIQTEAFACQKKMASIKKENSIMKEIREMLNEPNLPGSIQSKIAAAVEEYQNQKQKKSSISELLRPEFIRRDDEEASWKNAMRKSAKMLEEEGYIGSEYIEESIKHVEEYGDYIIIGDGIALAHAGKEFGVYKDGLSLLISEPGIVFSERNLKVHLLFCFATQGEKEYLELLKEIATLDKKRQKELFYLSENEVYENLKLL